MTGDAETLAEVIWEASRADESTISAIGAQHVARAVLASDWLAAVRDEAARGAGAKALEDAASDYAGRRLAASPRHEWDRAADWLRARAAALRAAPPTECHCPRGMGYQFHRHPCQHAGDIAAEETP